MKNEAVMEAVKKLRDKMGLIQVEFAVKIGKSYSSVQRYESKEPPPPVDLARFVYLAREVGAHDLAAIFKAAAITGIPKEVMELIREPEIEQPKIGEKTTQPGSVDKKRRAS